MKDLGFENKAVLITGASSGIGRETASCFGKEKAKLMLVARDIKRLEEVAAKI